MKKCWLVLIVLFLGLTMLKAGEVPESPVVVAPERDDARLGKDLAAFDIKTWRIVGKFWNQPEATVDMVDDHMEQHTERILGVLTSFGAVECSLDKDGGWIIGSGDIDRDQVFINSYLKRVSKIEAIKKGFVEDPAMSKIAREVVRKERAFRQNVCDTIMDDEPLESVDS